MWHGLKSMTLKGEKCDGSEEAGVGETMKYLLMYLRGEFPEGKGAEIAKAWSAWKMNRVIRFEVQSGITLSRNSTKESDLGLRGIDVIEAGSSKEALEIARACSGLPYGVSVEVWGELE